MIDALGELVDFCAFFSVQLVDALGQLGQSAAKLPRRNHGRLDLSNRLTQVGKIGARHGRINRVEAHLQRLDGASQSLGFARPLGEGLGLLLDPPETRRPRRRQRPQAPLRRRNGIGTRKAGAQAQIPAQPLVWPPEAHLRQRDRARSWMAAARGRRLNSRTYSSINIRG